MELEFFLSRDTPNINDLIMQMCAATEAQQYGFFFYCLFWQIGDLALSTGGDAVCL